MIKFVAVSLPNALMVVWKHFVTHGNQDLLEKLLALGLGRKSMGQSWSALSQQLARRPVKLLRSCPKTLGTSWKRLHQPQRG